MYASSSGRMKVEYDEFDKHFLCLYTIPTPSEKSKNVKYVTKTTMASTLDMSRYCVIYFDIFQNNLCDFDMILSFTIFEYSSIMFSLFFWASPY